MLLEVVDRDPPGSSDLLHIKASFLSLSLLNLVQGWACPKSPPAWLWTNPQKGKPGLPVCFFPSFQSGPISFGAFERGSQFRRILVYYCVYGSLPHILRSKLEMDECDWMKNVSSGGIVNWMLVDDAGGELDWAPRPLDWIWLLGFIFSSSQPKPTSFYFILLISLSEMWFLTLLQKDCFNP